MKVNPIQQPINFNGYKIKADENKHLKYLYNNVSDAIRNEGVTTVFTPTEIRLDRLTKSLREKLEKLKVIFKEDVK